MPNTIEIDDSGRVATVTLRRPEVHNAFNAEMIRELTDAFAAVSTAEETRVVVLAAEGKSFCAGADLHWMRAMVDYSFEENVGDAMGLARMLRTIYDCPKPVIGRIQGAAFGGGVGLAAVCDLAVAVESAVFCFSEVKLGLVPAVISPFVFRKIHPGPARRYFLTAEPFPAAEAHRLGLLAEVAPEVAALDAVVERWGEQLSANGPEALAACKQLIDDVTGPDWDAVLAITARRIAERRASAEGQEGMKAFLEKRPPAWRSAPEERRVP
jgi:methylglutaconyl-CoA hydratase